MTHANSVCLQGGRLKGLNMRIYSPPLHHHHPPPACLASWLISLFSPPPVSSFPLLYYFASKLAPPTPCPLFLSLPLKLLFCFRKPDSIFKFVTDSSSSCAYLNSQGDNYASLNDKQQKVQIPCPTTVSKLHDHFLK